jgi:hypothetical protein
MRTCGECALFVVDCGEAKGTCLVPIPLWAKGRSDWSFEKIRPSRDADNCPCFAPRDETKPTADHAGGINDE